MSREYRNEVDEKNNIKINELLNSMPEFIEDYYDSLVVNGSSTNTIKSYLYEVNVFLRFVATIVKKKSITDFEVTDLDKVTLTKINKFVASSESGVTLADTAKRRRLSVVKSIYKFYFKIGAITTNPVIDKEGAKLKEKEVIKLNEHQVRTLLDCIQNQNGIKEHSKAYSEKLVYRDLAIIMVLLGTGMRVSELVGLNINDYDLTTPVGSEEENALFLSTQRKRMGVSSIEKMLKKYCKAAGLPSNISPHKLRATFATTVYKNTNNIYAVKDALHHSSIETSKHYIGDKDERKQEAAIAAASLFS